MISRKQTSCALSEALACDSFKITIDFPEAVDFDHHGLTEKEFESISKKIKQELERDGYTIEMRNVSAGAYHCYIQFPGLLYKEGLSGHPEQKILTQLDSESQI
jgi:hypothetical protein